jgi:hypothetical protein
MSASPACRLCGGATETRFERVVLGRHRVRYHRCGACGLTQTDPPHWLAEAYGEALSATDTGLLARNLHSRAIVATFLHLAGVRDAPCLDWAGGAGVFTRLMRDAGFDYRWLDPLATNAFARGFEWREGLGTPAAITAFEVLEHLVRPLEEFGKVAAFGARWIVTSTELAPAGGPAADWFYLSAETGQHVAFYEAATLARLGRECGYPFVIAGPYRQVFAREPFPRWRWTLAERLGSVLYEWVRRRRRSLTVADCEALRTEVRS